MNYKIVGLLEDHGVKSERLKKFPVLGGFEDAEEVIKKTKVQRVFLAAPGLEQRKMRDLILRVHPLVKNLALIPNTIAVPMSNVEVESLVNESILLLKLNNNLTHKLNRPIKGTFDYILTFCGCIAISPILLYVAWKIHCDSPGPIIYDGERLGRNGKLFKCYKFRSMYTNGDEILAQYLADHPEEKQQWEEYHKLDNDPRVTPIGKFIRRTSIDELPQLLNVLLGDMSLVGPRPYLPREAEEMGEAKETILLAKPGITGYWQVNGRSDVTFAGRLKMDCWYVYNWSVWMDLGLLFRTVFVVLNKQGAK